MAIRGNASKFQLRQTTCQILEVRPSTDTAGLKGVCKEETNMLVLSRKLGERLLIGQDVTITILSMERGRVRLGIEAPTQLRVLREELRHPHLQLMRRLIKEATGT
jgi:carbon storage regulator